MKVSKTDMIVKDEKAFRLRVRHWKADNPSDLNAIEFVQECIGKDGEVDFTSTYQYNLTNDDLKQLAITMSRLAESA
jgi:hypothetical protein